MKEQIFDGAILAEGRILLKCGRFKSKQQTNRMRINAFKPAIVLALLFVACDHNKNVVPAVRTGVSGNIETIAGLGPANFGYDGDGSPAKSAKLGWLTGIAVDPSNNVYVTDG